MPLSYSTYAWLVCLHMVLHMAPSPQVPIPATHWDHSLPEITVEAEKQEPEETLEKENDYTLSTVIL